MSIFIKPAIKSGKNSIQVTIPKEIVEIYEIKEKDMLELDFVRNLHDGKKLKENK